jgi:hypothetical protein
VNKKRLTYNVYVAGILYVTGLRTISEQWEAATRLAQAQRDRKQPVEIHACRQLV